jgi:pSer/pThr/pTyr-binding forkhead associated (FHA) protein
MGAMSRKFTVGRDTGCDIAIADDSVSRIHAEFLVDADGQMVVVDNHSRNGTAVIRGGRRSRVEQASVSRDDEVQFGDVVLRVSDLLDAVRTKLPPQASSGELRPASVDPVEVLRASGESFWALMRRRWRESIVIGMALAGIILLSVDPQSQSFKFIVGIIGSVIASLVLSMVQQYWQKK